MGKEKISEDKKALVKGKYEDTEYWSSCKGTVKKDV